MLKAEVVDPFEMEGKPIEEAKVLLIDDFWSFTFLIFFSSFFFSCFKLLASTFTFLKLSSMLSILDSNL